MTVYWLDWEHGDDTADGLTPDTAFLTEGRVFRAEQQLEDLLVAVVSINQDGLQVVTTRATMAAEMQ